MHQHHGLPGLPAWLLALLCAATGVYCLLRTRTGPRAERAVMAGEALMAFGMAAMARPETSTALSSWSGFLYAAVLGVGALATLMFAGRDRHHLHHAVGSLAMVYMVLAMPSGGGHSGMASTTPFVPAAAASALTGVLLVYFVGYALYAGITLVPAAPAASAANGGPPPPRTRTSLTHVCRLTMAMAMLVMLAAH